MRNPFEKLRQLVQLGEVLEPSPPPAPPGTEHVMVEIAPGVFRSVNRQRRPQSSRLLLELQQAQALHKDLSGKFARVGQAMRATRPQPERSSIPDARRTGQR
jgi:hypothetical protein